MSRAEPSKDGSDDASLLQRIRQQDSDGLLLLYRKYAGRVFSLAYRILSERAPAEEVVQDVFYRVWEKSSLYREDGAFLAWLLTLTRNIALDYRRKETRRADFFVSFNRDDQTMEAAGKVALETPENADAIAKALAALPPAQRTVVEKLYFEGLTNSELARALGEPLATIKTRARLAFKKMRGALLGVEELP